MIDAVSMMCGVCVSFEMEDAVVESRVGRFLFRARWPSASGVHSSGMRCVVCVVCRVFYRYSVTMVRITMDLDCVCGHT